MGAFPIKPSCNVFVDYSRLNSTEFRSDLTRLNILNVENLSCIKVEDVIDKFYDDITHLVDKFKCEHKVKGNHSNKKWYNDSVHKAKQKRRSLESGVQVDLILTYSAIEIIARNLII